SDDASADCAAPYGLRQLSVANAVADTDLASEPSAHFVRLGPRDLLHPDPVVDLLDDLRIGSAVSRRDDDRARFGRGASTIVIPPGNGGTDAEIVEQVDDGVWVQQIAWAQPDEMGGRFGGEIRIGYRIRHGKLAEPVRGGTVGGGVVTREGTPSLLHDLSVIGARPKLIGSLSSQKLLVRNISVSGK